MKFVRFAGIIVLVCLCGAPAAAGAQSWNVPSGDVQVRCRMTVGGSFNAVTSSLSGTLQPGSPDGGDYAGELRVDLSDVRHRHRFAGQPSPGQLPRGGARSGVPAGGALQHRARRPAAGRWRPSRDGVLGQCSPCTGCNAQSRATAELRRRDGRMQVEATFSVSLEAFDIPPPRYLGVGVRDTVEITVSFDAMGGDTSSNGGTR